MLENQTDLERTKLARRHKVLHDRRSRYTLAGHVFLYGRDKELIRAAVFRDNINRGGKCDICGKQLAHWDGDLEHKNGGRKNARCDCYHQVLNDGNICSNLQRSCSMFARGSCHAKKHGRIIQWTPKSSS